MPDEAELRVLERHLRGLPEAAMRREVVLHALEGGEPDEAYALLYEALARPEAERPGLDTLRRTLREVLVEGGAARPLDYERRAALYALAAAREDALVVRLLRSPDTAETMAEPERALPRALAEIPLGVRRALARGVDAALLDRLLLDPDPVVIEHLLENARITEDHVVRIAARRPVAASTLAAIHRSRRFAARPRVRLALARNPYCPTDLALEILGSLPAEDLREVAGDATLHAEVRRQAHDELARRGRE